MTISDNNKIHFKELSNSTWEDFETLFGERGACGGCWCMYWRIKAKEFEKQKGDGNKNAMMELVKQKRMTGLIFYINDLPVGWCSAAPREDFPRLANSRILKPVDDKPVWSVVCLFIHKDYRRKGLSSRILASVVEFCKSEGAKIVEGYPVDPYENKMPAAFAWTGITSAFNQAGFKEVERRSKSRPIMRFYI
ncbi:MAG: GNAT family N-acetyltransferase [Melioribacteraceae bacterium]|nr:GNAT family N-acetyltransferase [Melioribacteraceae bacterium]MCF8356822.1 GNAT family N-acetyltransferase [Melioribacteraceae bacterium]MCF8396191.1 GNAT family N-acetyltransferase [Melioribacteraceae bacterium]MCF8421139.1 GNAT family N-acetyltransferase [Melioribacteraceae bacterium]